ncbi:MAG: MBL fold metallo-hydrolase [Oscillospiraceae bacterium]|nr:MBL fold metallo-hydrolase [Oscillospiraceae bacterium]
MENVQRIKCGNGNCYIVSNGENAVLVDTCREKYRDRILNACKPYNIRLLILTHGHLDHVQNAAFLAKELNVPIAMSKADLELIDNNIAQSLEAESFMGKIVLAVSIKSLSTEKFTKFTPTVFLNEGDTLEPYGINAKVLAVPGHTDGSIALDVGGKFLIVGDALMNMFYPTVSMLYHDKEVMLKSAERIGDLGERAIYFGHGKPLSNRAWVKK